MNYVWMCIISLFTIVYVVLVYPYRIVINVLSNVMWYCSSCTIFDYILFSTRSQWLKETDGRNILGKGLPLQTSSVDGIEIINSSPGMVDFTAGSHWFPLVGDGHQLNWRVVLYTHYKDSLFFRLDESHLPYQELIDPEKHMIKGKKLSTRDGEYPRYTNLYHLYMDYIMVVYMGYMGVIFLGSPNCPFRVPCPNQPRNAAVSFEVSLEAVPYGSEDTSHDSSIHVTLMHQLSKRPAGFTTQNRKKWLGGDTSNRCIYIYTYVHIYADDEYISIYGHIYVYIYFFSVYIHTYRCYWLSLATRVGTQMVV